MSNQHIQKQIDLLENADIWKEVEDDFSIGDGGSHSEINLDKVKAFLKTSLERVWEDAEKEMLDKVIEKIEDYVYLAPFSEKTKIRISKLSEILETLKQTT